MFKVFVNLCKKNHSNYSIINHSIIFHSQKEYSCQTECRPAIQEFRETCLKKKRSSQYSLGYCTFTGMCLARSMRRIIRLSRQINRSKAEKIRFEHASQGEMFEHVSKHCNENCKNLTRIQCMQKKWRTASHNKNMKIQQREYSARVFFLFVANGKCNMVFNFSKQHKSVLTS